MKPFPPGSRNAEGPGTQEGLGGVPGQHPTPLPPQGGSDMKPFPPGSRIAEGPGTQEGVGMRPGIAERRGV
jgi:hypothetical protein